MSGDCQNEVAWCVLLVDNIIVVDETSKGGSESLKVLKLAGGTRAIILESQITNTEE